MPASTPKSAELNPTASGAAAAVSTSTSPVDLTVTTSSFGALEAHLREAPIAAVVVPAAVTAFPSLAGAWRHKFIVVLEGGVHVVVKPADGVDASEDPDRLINNEIAAWALAKQLGWQRLLPATVDRTLVNPHTSNRVRAALVVFFPSTDWMPSVTDLSTDETLKASAFDHLIGQTDRGGNNWMGAPAGPGHQLLLIDHAYAFGARPGTASSFKDHHRGQDLGDAILADLQELVARGASEELSGLLPRDEVTAMLDRATELLSSRRLS